MKMTERGELAVHICIRSRIDQWHIRLLQMSEIDRENILAQRQEEMQRMQDKRNLDQMLRERSGGGEDNVSKAAKRMEGIRDSATYVLIPYSRTTRTAGCHQGEIAETGRAQSKTQSEGREETCTMHFRLLLDTGLIATDENGLAETRSILVSHGHGLI